MGWRLDTRFTPHAIENLQDYYFPYVQPTTLYQTPKNSKQIIGYGVGLVGDVLIYDQNGYCFTLSLKPLIGQAEFILEEEVLPQHFTNQGLQMQLDLFS